MQFRISRNCGYVLILRGRYGEAVPSYVVRSQRPFSRKRRACSVLTAVLVARRAGGEEQQSPDGQSPRAKATDRPNGALLFDSLLKAQTRDNLSVFCADGAGVCNARNNARS